jgi:hypothetical protein
MDSQMMMSPSTHKTLQDCATMCEKTFNMLLSRQDAHFRKNQLKLLLDCATICEICAKFMARHSVLIKSLCEYCAYVCEVCGNECLRYPDQESQMCGRMCLNCARECRAFAMQHSGGM